MSEFSYTVTSTAGDVQPDITPQDFDSQLNSITEQRNKLLMAEGALLEKAFKSDDPGNIIKANKRWEDIQQRQNKEIKSYLVEPNSEWSHAVGYKYKRFSVPFEMATKMAKTPVIRAIISTRQAQVSAFCRPQRSRFETGFKIMKKREYYEEDEPTITNKDKKIINHITNVILNCGDKQNAWHGDTFDSFLKKIVEDSLVLDQACFEVVRNLKGQPIEFLAVDGRTIRVADSFDDDYYEKHGGAQKEKINGYYPSYVQVINAKIKAEYYPWELCFGQRNVSTDIRNNGYGSSEVEELISIVTWMLYADAYNGKFFSQGAAPKGLLKVAGNVNRNRLMEFRQQWLSMVTGVENAWKTPVIESDKMEWIDLQQKNTDMQFAQWQEYLIKVACAIFKIAPEEVGFNLGNASGGNAMFESNNEARLKYSRDKGLKPLLRSIEFWINKWIVNPIDENFEFRFVGLDIDSEEKELELDIKKVGAFMGFKEIRKKYNLPDELEEGDFILNQVYAQFAQQQQFADEQAESNETMDEYDSGSFWDDLPDQSDPDVEKSIKDPLLLDALKMTANAKAD